MRIVKTSLILILMIFVLPALLHLGLWASKGWPQGWRYANWSSAGILPKTPEEKSAQILVLAARTGGFKGAFADHSWIVLKRPGAATYDRYDVVGWGTPVRKNAYDADGHWYSNRPRIVFELNGSKAERLIPQMERAIASYQWSRHGDYTIWPGPNSNTFVSAILQAVPELGATTPSTAIGRDYPFDGKWVGQRKDGSLYASLGGYAGVVIGRKPGFELNFIGLVAGINPFDATLKVPGFGEINLAPRALADLNH